MAVVVCNGQLQLSLPGALPQRSQLTARRARARPGGAAAAALSPDSLHESSGRLGFGQAVGSMLDNNQLLSHTVELAAPVRTGRLKTRFDGSAARFHRTL